MFETSPCRNQYSVEDEPRNFPTQGYRTRGTRPSDGRTTFSAHCNGTCRESVHLRDRISRLDQLTRKAQRVGESTCSRWEWEDDDASPTLFVVLALPSRILLTTGMNSAGFAAATRPFSAHRSQTVLQLFVSRLHADYSAILNQLSIPQIYNIKNKLY